MRTVLDHGSYVFLRIHLLKRLRLFRSEPHGKILRLAEFEGVCPRRSGDVPLSFEARPHVSSCHRVCKNVRAPENNLLSTPCIASLLFALCFLLCLSLLQMGLAICFVFQMCVCVCVLALGILLLLLHVLITLELPASSLIFASSSVCFSRRAWLGCVFIQVCVCMCVCRG